MLKALLLEPCIMVRVQTWASQAVAPREVEQALGITWPKESGARSSDRADIVCIGPTDWLIIATDPTAGALVKRIVAAFEQSAFRATIVSQALARIEIDGVDARVLLAKACSLDLHPSRFPWGRSVRTRFAGMPVIVRCIKEFTFECIVTSSYADYLLSWLTDAAAEFS